MTKPSPIHRRGFLAGCVAATGVGICCLGAGSLALSRPVFASRLVTPTLAMLTKNDFEPRIGSSFQLELEADDTVGVELVEVSGFPAGAMREGASREPFSILFRGPAELQVSQQIYRITHPELGSHEIFLVPLGPDDKGMRLEAVFS